MLRLSRGLTCCCRGSVGWLLLFTRIMSLLLLLLLLLLEMLLGLLWVVCWGRPLVRDGTENGLGLARTMGRCWSMIAAHRACTACLRARHWQI